MWIEDKSENGLWGPARIGRVTFSKSGRSIVYRGRQFASQDGAGFKSNYVEVATGKPFWISGCREDGGDALYSVPVEIDEEAREEYWLEIRKLPNKVGVESFRARGKYRR